MGKFKLHYIFLVLVSFLNFENLVYSDTLPNGIISLHQDLTYTKATAMSAMAGGGVEVPFVNPGSSLNAVREAFASGLNAAFGLPYELEFDFKISYSSSRMRIDGFANRSVGSVNAHVNEVGFGITRQLVRSDAIGFAIRGGVKAPGNTTVSGDDFLSNSDNLTSYELWFLNSFFMIANVNAFLNLGYSTRTGIEPTGSQILGSLGLNFSITQSLQAGASLNYLNTFSGVDVATPEFVAIMMSTGAPPFSRKKERFMGYALVSSYQINENWYADGFYSTKFESYNTDRGTTIGVGAGYIF